MKIIIDASFNQNTYIENIDGKIVIVDPGYNAKRIEEYFVNEKPFAILLTHYHFDHTSSTSELCKKYGIKAYIHKDDYEILFNNNLASQMGFKDPLINKSDIVVFEDRIEQLPSLEIIHAPGHSEGSVLYKNNGNLFTGDVLFVDTYGRVDLAGSNPSKQTETLKNFNNLDPNLHIYPGHGENDTLANIIKNNNFF